jgi:hypothetical protein
MGGMALAMSVDGMHRLKGLTLTGSVRGASAGLDQLQYLGTKPPSAALAVERLEDQAGRCRQITDLGALASLPIQLLGSKHQVGAIRNLNRGGGVTGGGSLERR